MSWTFLRPRRDVSSPGSRVLALGPLLLALLLMGPAPGETGGCGGELPVADAADFCAERDGYVCRRAEARGEITNVRECFDAIEERCDRASWPITCDPPPTRAETDACIDELRRVDNLNVDEADIAECRLCSGLGG